MGTKDDPATLLRRRTREHGLSQADIGRLFGKSRAWASQELFADPQKVLRRILVDDPTRLDALARALAWDNRDEMLRDLDVFGSATLRPSPTPHQPLTDAERRGWQLPPEEEPEIPATLLEAAEMYGHGKNAPLAERRWLLELAGLDFREEPETPEDWLAIYARLSKLIDPK